MNKLEALSNKENLATNREANTAIKYTPENKISRNFWYCGGVYFIWRGTKSITAPKTASRQETCD
jgi:hypothetical protein